ncbi:MAG: hypothetical protein ACP5HU_12435 [Phycisphaerae bacterium]
MGGQVMGVDRRLIFSLVLVACAGGCAAPSVDVAHVLPAPVELPAGGEVRAGSFDVGESGEAWMADFLRVEVARQMEGLSGAAGTDEPLDVDGVATVRVTDDSGVREARRYDGQGRPETVELPYLVRMVDVGVVFTITSASGGSVELETHRNYDSSRDPGIRGKYGLYRGDDPERVPPTDDIVRKLLVECVEQAGGMVRPVEVPVTLQFRYAGGEASQAGLKAVEKGDFRRAVERFREAAESRGDDVALLFNLAAASEAAGRLRDAREHYQAALDASGGEDAEAAEAVRRTQALLSRMPS